MSKKSQRPGAGAEVDPQDVGQDESRKTAAPQDPTGLGEDRKRRTGSTNGKGAHPSKQPGTNKDGGTPPAEDKG